MFTHETFTVAPRTVALAEYHFHACSTPIIPPEAADGYIHSGAECSLIEGLIHLRLYPVVAVAYYHILPTRLVHTRLTRCRYPPH